MARGSYNISVSSDSNLEEEKNNNKIQECMNSCLGSGFLRSLSLHDRPRSSRVPTKKELLISRYKALIEKISPSKPPPSSEARSESGTNSCFESVGINVETQVTTQPSICNATPTVTRQESGQNQLLEPVCWLEDRYARFSVESGKLLEKTVSILRTVDGDISESLNNLSRPESIAQESVVEAYRNKGKDIAGCSAGPELDLSMESASESMYENWQPSIQQRPKDVQGQYTSRGQNLNSAEAELDLSVESSSESIYENWPRNLNSAEAELDLSIESFSESIYENIPSVQQRPKDIQLHSSSGKQIPHSASSELDLSTESSREPIYENWQPSVQQRSKDAQAHSTPRRTKDFQAHSSQPSPKNEQSPSSPQSPKIMQVQSSQQSPKNAKTCSFQRSPKNLPTSSSQQSPKNLPTSSSEQSPKNLPTSSSEQSPKNLPTSSSQQIPKNFQAPSMQQSPTNLQAQSSQQSSKYLLTKSSQQSPKNLLVSSTQETLNFESPLSSNSGNTQSLTKPDLDAVRSAEQSPRNLSSPYASPPGDSTKAKSIEFDLPSDHEQFVKIIEALQIRCLEYREMIQDIAVSALEECVNFPEPSVNRIRRLRCQFERQKRNFRDFKELCCNSVVFGPDSLPINEKVTEVIQSFYLKLLQEENETFMARLEYGLKMGETYAKMLKLETESKNIIRTLEKEILYLKKTSVGFKV